MISISPTTYDLTGSLRFAELPTSALRESERRMSRRALLDGTVSIYDGGYSDGDRTFRVSLTATKAQADRAQEIMETYNRVTVSTPVGCYLCALQNVSYSPPTMTLTLWVETRKDAG